MLSAKPDTRRRILIKVFLTATHLGIVTEYAREGDLRGLLDKRRRLAEGKARFLLQQLVSAVAYCHCEARRDTHPARPRRRVGDQRCPVLRSEEHLHALSGSSPTPMRARTWRTQAAPQEVQRQAAASVASILACVMWTCSPAVRQEYPCI
jgi:hypothetical protein